MLDQAGATGRDGDFNQSIPLAKVTLSSSGMTGGRLVAPPATVVIPAGSPSGSPSVL